VEQYQFPHINAAAGFEPAEIHAAGERLGIQLTLVLTGGPHRIDQSRNLLAEYILH